jgi:hypothetical protein
MIALVVLIERLLRPPPHPHAPRLFHVVLSELVIPHRIGRQRVYLVSREILVLDHGYGPEVRDSPIFSLPGTTFLPDLTKFSLNLIKFPLLFKFS